MADSYEKGKRLQKILWRSLLRIGSKENKNLQIDAEREKRNRFLTKINKKSEGENYIYQNI